MTQQKRALAVAMALGLSACGGAATSPSVTPLSGAASSAVPDRDNLNMVLRSHLSLAQLGATAGSGNWGYTAPNGRRLALVGHSKGLSVVDVTNPSSPRITGTIVGGSSQWREVKTYKNFAYVTTEAQTGLDIVDLSNPDRPKKVRTLNTTFKSAHTITIDQARGLAYVNGTQSGMHVLDLAANPSNPPDIGRFDSYYVHDAYARGTLLYAACIYEGFLAILDVSQPAAIHEVTRWTTGGAFTHNAWLTDDGHYLFTTDERPWFPIEGWNLDVTPPRKVSEYIGAPGTIPHNVMIDGDRLVLSHYTEGVHMLDITDPASPHVLGRYDTYLGNSQGFAGAWSAYIFPGSNLIVVGDINGGLFVVEYTGP
jgi:choice-of-anchor B domain-containing protein